MSPSPVDTLIRVNSTLSGAPVGPPGEPHQLQNFSRALRRDRTNTTYVDIRNIFIMRGWLMNYRGEKSHSPPPARWGLRKTMIGF